MNIEIFGCIIFYFLWPVEHFPKHEKKKKKHYETGSWYSILMALTFTSVLLQKEGKKIITSIVYDPEDEIQHEATPKARAPRCKGCGVMHHTTVIS